MQALSTLPQYSVAIIGGGPAGLMAAEVLSLAGIGVTLFDSMPSVGRKFLMAGKGGMNITHAESFEPFLSRYGSRQTLLQSHLEQFGPGQLRSWLSTLGIATFVGSSGRVFPEDMKAAPLLRLWLHRLRSAGVKFQVRHRWLGWLDNDPLTLHFAGPNGSVVTSFDAVVLALGGGSWARLGSTGAWIEVFQQRGIATAPLKPSNCGFETPWSDYFKQRFAGHPLKGVKLLFDNRAGEHFEQLGELMLTEEGIEGGLVYALSAPLRDEIIAESSATCYIDLLPNRSVAWLVQQLSAPRAKMSMANYLRKRVNLDGVKSALLREALSAEDCASVSTLSATIKALPIKLVATRPLDEAISSAGGVVFDELNAQLMLRKLPGVFCAGEMLDWEAPTGGYLLSACFATGMAAGLGVRDWLFSKS